MKCAIVFCILIGYIGLNLGSVLTSKANVLNSLSGGMLTPGNVKMEWTQYHPLEDIYEWVDAIAADNPDTITQYDIGTTYEGRSIKALRLSHKANNKAIFIESNIHAREWISSSTGTCFFNSLLYSNDPRIRYLAETYDWIFVPILNPDGYAYSHTGTFWRKNRKPTGYANSTGICYGVDLNRNFNIHWKENAHDVDDPCGHYFAGSEPESQAEIQALRKFVRHFPMDYIKMYFALHSYGNFVLIPPAKSLDNATLTSIGNGFADAARAKYGTNFLCGLSSVLLNSVSGTAKDWAYEIERIPFTATIELRDHGEHGFFLPADQIIEVCEEVTEGFIGVVATAELLKLFH